MAGSEEIFGEGLEQQLQTPPVAPDPFLSKFRELVNGVPDDFTTEQVADHLVKLQEQAAKAEQYEQQLAALQAQQVQAVAEMSKQQTPAETKVEAQARRRWEREQVEPEIAALVQFDAATRSYVPKNQMSPIHVQAANRVNQIAGQEQEFTRAFVSDPYGIAKELLQDEFAARDKAWEERFKNFEEQLTPFQQMQMEAAAQKESADFAAKHPDVFDENGDLTVIGEFVNLGITNGLEMEAAYEAAVKKAEKFGIQTARQQKPPATRPVLTAPAKPARTVDRIQERMGKQGQVPPNHNQFDGHKRFRTSWDELRQNALAANDEN